MKFGGPRSEMSSGLSVSWFLSRALLMCVFFSVTIYRAETTYARLGMENDVDDPADTLIHSKDELLATYPLCPLGQKCRRKRHAEFDKGFLKEMTKKPTRTLHRRSSTLPSTKLGKQIYKAVKLGKTGHSGLSNYYIQIIKKTMVKHPSVICRMKAIKTLDNIRLLSLQQALEQIIILEQFCPENPMKRKMGIENSIIFPLKKSRKKEPKVHETKLPKTKLGKQIYKAVKLAKTGHSGLANYYIQIIKKAMAKHPKVICRIKAIKTLDNISLLSLQQALENILILEQFCPENSKKRRLGIKKSSKFPRKSWKNEPKDHETLKHFSKKKKIDTNSGRFHLTDKENTLNSFFPERKTKKMSTKRKIDRKMMNAKLKNDRKSQNLKGKNDHSPVIDMTSSTMSPSTPFETVQSIAPKLINLINERKKDEEMDNNSMIQMQVQISKLQNAGDKQNLGLILTLIDQKRYREAGTKIAELMNRQPTAVKTPTNIQQNTNRTLKPPSEFKK